MFPLYECKHAINYEGEFESRSGRGVQQYATGRCYSPVSSIDKTDPHDIAEMLLKVALNTIKQTYQIILI